MLFNLNDYPRKQFKKFSLFVKRDLSNPQTKRVRQKTKVQVIKRKGILEFLVQETGGERESAYHESNTSATSQMRCSLTTEMLKFTNFKLFLINYLYENACPFSAFLTFSFLMVH